MRTLIAGLVLASTYASSALGQTTVSPRPELSPSQGSSDRSSPSPGTTTDPTPGTPGGTGSKREETPPGTSGKQPASPQEPASDRPAAQSPGN